MGFETAQYAEMIREMVALNDETTNMKGVLKRYVEAALDPRRLLEPVPAPPLSGLKTDSIHRAEIEVTESDDLHADPLDLVSHRLAVTSS